MLNLDVAAYPDEAAKKIIADHCSRFGNVTRVTIFRPARAGHAAFALVNMASQRESEALRTMLGDSTLGNAVLIRLK